MSHDEDDDSDFDVLDVERGIDELQDMRDELEKLRVENAMLRARLAPSGLFYVLSLRYTTQDAVLWWGPHRSGYTQRLDEAGRYTRAEIDGDSLDDREHTLAFPTEAVDAAVCPVCPPRQLRHLVEQRGLELEPHEGYGGGWRAVTAPPTQKEPTT